MLVGQHLNLLMDQLKNSTHSASVPGDIGSKGVEFLDLTQPTDYKGPTASNAFVENSNDEGQPGIPVNEILIQNSRQAATTFSWLKQNYEASQGYSLPRCLIYEHYLDFCQRNFLQPVNAASFGKTIRQVFPDIRTRRLGTRGQSKYHYYGIKVRCDSPYYSTIVISQRMSLPCPATGGQWLTKTFNTIPSPSTYSTVPSTLTNMSSSHDGDHSQTSVGKGVGDAGKGSGEGGIDGGNSSSGKKRDERDHTPVKPFSARELPLPMTPLIQPGSNSLLPAFPTARELLQLQQSTNKQEVDEFLEDYRVHCSFVLESIMRGGLDKVDYTYWTNLPVAQKRLLEIPSLWDVLAICDTYLYHTIVSVLIPGTLMFVPESLLQSIRQFSHKIPRIMESSLQSFPIQLKQSKLLAVKRFSRLLKRKTSLAHLAQASRSALAVDITINQMRQDWERRTEHDTVCSQLMWTMPEIKELKHHDIRRHMDSFKKLLESRATVEDHVKWVEDVRSFYVEKGYPRGSVQYEKAEEVFFKGWNYVCSLIIRDQTLRSATSFGSFHLLNLLYEEYLLYVTEVHRYQREEVALWNNVMDPSLPMADGFLLNDVDLDLDDCDDLFDVSTSSMMSMGAGDDLFDDDAILPTSTSTSAAPPQPTHADELQSTQSAGFNGKTKSNQCENATRHSKPVLPKREIVSVPPASSRASNDKMPREIAATDQHSEGIVPNLPPAKPAKSIDVGNSPNATTEEKKTTSKETAAFVTTKLIRATLLTPCDPSKASSGASTQASEPGVDTDKEQKEAPAAPQVLTLNVPILPGLDLHKGQFLTAGDGNKYIINDVQTVLQPVKEEK